MQGQGGDAPRWSIAIHWVCWPWGLLGDTAPTCVLSKAPCLSCKSILRWLLTSAGLRDPQVKLSCDSTLAATRVH